MSASGTQGPEQDILIVSAFSDGVGGITSMKATRAGEGRGKGRKKMRRTVRMAGTCGMMVYLMREKGGCVSQVRL